MIKSDPWHYPRETLAKQVLGMFESQLSNALVFFAPRRMGKTEFLRKDVMPLAEKKGWLVFYFSFLDVADHPAEELVKALLQYAEENNIIKNKETFWSKISKISLKASAMSTGIDGSVELNKKPKKQLEYNFKELLAQIAKKSKLLLLMDEIQMLAEPKNASFMAAFRTVLDINKDLIKVIFTGSSQNGLRRMFSQSKAPFFHFGLNIDFPKLHQEFTDHLADMFQKVTQRTLDKKALWNAFESLEQVTQLGRLLVEKLALNPNLNIEDAQQQLMAEISNDRKYQEQWGSCSHLEQQLLIFIAKEQAGLFSVETREKLAQKLGVPELGTPTVQSALRTLNRKDLIRIHDRSDYDVEDPNFKHWILTLY